jgi:hypothetical protein
MLFLEQSVLYCLRIVVRLCQDERVTQHVLAAGGVGAGAAARLVTIFPLHPNRPELWRSVFTCVADLCNSTTALGKLVVVV